MTWVAISGRPWPWELVSAAESGSVAVPPQHLALMEALAAGVDPKQAHKERRVAVRCAYAHVWCVISLHSVRAFQG